MAKAKEPIAVETKEVAPAAKSGDVVVAAASAELMARFEEVRENFESVEDFKLPRVKATGDGFEVVEGQEPIMTLTGVIVHTKKTNVYYDKPYNKKDIQPPTCFSLDGEKPDSKVAKPIHPTCKGCPMAQFGTSSTKTGKACRNLKPFYLLLSDEAIMPRQLTVTPTSLKPAQNYMIELAERGLNYSKVETIIEAYKKDDDDKYVHLKFKLGKKLEPQRVEDVKFLKARWLPVMNAQNVEQREFETESAPKAPVTSAGEY